MDLNKYEALAADLEASLQRAQALADNAAADPGRRANAALAARSYRRALASLEAAWDAAVAGHWSLTEAEQPF